MQAGNAHQVVYPGTGEYLPLRWRDAALVADCQRAQYPCIRRAAERRIELVAYRFAPCFDAVAETAGEFVDAPVVTLVVHITCCADIALQRPHFEIEAVRVCRAMRLLEAQREPPAFPCLKLERLCLVVEPGAEVDMLRHAGLRCEGLFHIEVEAQAALVMARQFRNHADHFDVAPLPFRRQAHRKALFGLPCSVIEARSAGEGGEQQEADGDRKSTR